MPLVLDASVALAWCFRDEHSPYAEAVREVLANDQAVVPDFWALEVSNGVRMGERRGRATTAEAYRFIQLILTLDVESVPLSVNESLTDVHRLALAQNLTSYDAAYLHLGVINGLPIATQDTDLIRAMNSLGVPLFEPQ